MRFASTIAIAAAFVAGTHALPAAVTPRASAAKKGLGFNDVTATTAFGNQVSWAYNWDSSHPPALVNGVQYVPMLFSTLADHTTPWVANANAALASGSDHILGFNEPDLSSQANMSPADAAAAWKKFIEPFAGKAKLVSPAVTNGAPPLGLGWLDDFLAACSDCTIDAIAIHIYDAADNVPYFQQYITDVGTKYNKPVWVTEFGASGTVDEQVAFMQTMLPFLDGLATVERYNYFGDFVDTFVDANKQLLPLGQAYASS